MQNSNIPKRKIQKSEGFTDTERFLANLCESTFLKLWSYPNPFKDDAHELCDLIAVFENEVFVFFDREKHFEFNENKEPKTLWDRWKRKVIDNQVRTAKGAERYLRSSRKIFIDNKLEQELPVQIDPSTATYHKIIVAHGAAEACKNFSEDNISGSLAISYSTGNIAPPFPFFVSLDRSDPVHVLDTNTLPLIMQELDTISDFSRYLRTKLEAISRYDFLTYCGEEDLLAHYLLNFDEETKTNQIGSKDESINWVTIGEGEWNDFSNLDVYITTKKHNEVSYLWDDVIQRTSQNALDGTIRGRNPLEGKGAIHEMAKEPRFVRRALSRQMIRAIQNYPDKVEGIFRNLTFMPSFQPGKAYIFLQVTLPPSLRARSDYRQKRQAMLEVACGAAKINFPELKIIVGLLIESPKHCEDNSEDFLAFYCDTLSSDDLRYYKKRGDEFGFFKTGERVQKTVYQFVTENSDD